MRCAGNRCSTNIFRSVRAKEGKHSARSTSPRTTGSTWMASPVSTEFATFWPHAVSNSPRETLTTPQRSRQCADSGIARTTWSTMSSPTWASRLTKEPCDSSISSDAMGSIAVVTSSQNCTAVLKAAKLDDLFDVQVDGNTIHAQRLAGKPAPDTFLLAAKLLGVEPTRAVVVEDAISGVQAGVKGKFGLVIGIARKGNTEELKHHGAHLVVDDLAELVD